MLEVTSAEYIDGYKIHLSFNTGESGVIDLKDSLWGPMFEPLKDIDVFKRFRLSEILHTLCWDNDADFAPEYLLEKMIEQIHEAPSTMHQ
ncbi:MAG: DUF2442 domain-containing protein [Thermoguttaceae bacterium]|jgi:hypothetical protein